MNFLMKRSCIGVRELKHIGSKRVTETLNSSMLTLRKGESKTKSWGFGMITADGVRRRKVLLRLLLLILKASIPLLVPFGLKMLWRPFPPGCQRI